MAWTKREFTLYWSSLEMFEGCPQNFLWSKGWGDIDLGRGPGRSKAKPEKDSKHHAVMGIAIQKVVERLYNDELWRQPQGLVDRLADMAEQECQAEIARNFIDWTESPPREDLIRTCRDGVTGYLRTMKANRLLGPYAKAEVELLGRINETVAVGGRADLIIRREDASGVTILDGKNSSSKGKYTDPDQLRWYALLFYLCYGILPDRLGFVYYRYPHDPNTGESGVDWVDFTKDDIRGLAKRAVEARTEMQAERFPATPTPKTCRFCDYETVCPARTAQREANAAKRRKGSGATATSSLPMEDGSFYDLTLDSAPKVREG